MAAGNDSVHYFGAIQTIRPLLTDSASNQKMLIIFGVEWCTNNLEKYSGSIVNVSQGSVAMSVSGIE
jgi:hypothetical protein